PLVPARLLDRGTGRLGRTDPRQRGQARLGVLQQRPGVLRDQEREGADAAVEGETGVAWRGRGRGTGRGMPAADSIAPTARVIASRTNGAASASTAAGAASSRHRKLASASSAATLWVTITPYAHAA